MSRYVKGRRFEYEVRDLLRKWEFTVFRCAGSKPIDLIAFPRREVCPLLIECKTGAIRASDAADLGKLMSNVPGVHVLLVLKGDRGYKRACEMLAHTMVNCFTLETLKGYLGGYFEGGGAKDAAKD